MPTPDPHMSLASPRAAAASGEIVVAPASAGEIEALVTDPTLRDEFDTWQGPGQAPASSCDASTAAKKP